MLSRTICLLFASFASAALTIEDPSDTDVKPILYQIIPVVGHHVYNDTTTTVSHQLLTVDANDTSTVVITDRAKVSIEYSDIVKFGYASNLLQSSFFGINAAVNVANGSIARLSNVNVTTHNGAANLYAFGDGTVAYVDNAALLFEERWMPQVRQCPHRLCSTEGFSF